MVRDATLAKGVFQRTSQRVHAAEHRAISRPKQTFGRTVHDLIGDVIGFFLVLALCGLAGGNTTAISYSMKADLIEIAGHRTGEHVAGAYMAVWSFGSKAAAAIAVGIALPLLKAFGFDPQADNGPEAIDALRYNLTVPTTLLYFLAIPIILRFPLSAERLVRMRGAFERRAERRASEGQQA